MMATALDTDALNTQGLAQYQHVLDALRQTNGRASGLVLQRNPAAEAKKLQLPRILDWRTGAGADVDGSTTWPDLIGLCAWWVDGSREEGADLLREILAYAPPPPAIGRSVDDRPPHAAPERTPRGSLTRSLRRA